MSEPLFIGIEACRKDFTVLVVADQTGVIKTADHFPERLNFHEMSKHKLAAEIYDLVKRILEPCGITVTQFIKEGGKICAGIRGVSTKYDRELGMREVWKAAGLWGDGRFATGDIEIIFSGATRSLEGGAIICQAGSVAMARTDKTISRVGGWGPMLGDEGSGYWIGSKALKALCQLRDGRLSVETVLARYVTEQLNTNRTWVDLLREHSSVSRRWTDALILLAHETREDNEFHYIVSSLAEAVFKAWYEHPTDPVVSLIVDNAAKTLIEQVGTAIETTGLSRKQMPLVLWGDFFRYKPSSGLSSPPFFDLVAEKARARWPQIQIVPPNNPRTMRPVIGALLHAISGSLLALPEQDVIERIEQNASEFNLFYTDAEMDIMTRT